MEIWTGAYGSTLTALGLGGYLATGAEHKTALIPAAFGVAELGLALLGAKGRPAAAVVGALGFAGAARGLPKLKTLLEGGEVERPAAVVAQSIMAGLSVIYVAGAVRSLLKGR